jgi:hypothetical protein
VENGTGRTVLNRTAGVRQEAVLIPIPSEYPAHQQQHRGYRSTNRRGDCDAKVKSMRDKDQCTLLPFLPPCRYRPIEKCVSLLLPFPSTTGLTLKEKLSEQSEGGERGGREKRREGGP